MESNPQGMPIGKWVWDVGGSKGQPVTGWIGSIPDLKGCRLPTGASVRESWQNHD